MNTVADDSIIRGKCKFSVPAKLNSEGVKIITPSIKHNNISIKKVTLSKPNTFIEIEVSTSFTYEKFTVATDKGVTIDPISCEDNKNLETQMNS